MPDLRPFLDPATAAAQAACDGEARDAAAKYADLDGRRATAEQRAAGLQSRIDDLIANPKTDAILWKKGTRIEPGKVYRLVGPVSLQCNVGGVRFVGGTDPAWPDGGSGITFSPAAFDCAVDGVHWHKPDGPAGAVKVGLRAAILCCGTDILIARCKADRIDNFVEAMTGCNGITFAENLGTEDLRGGFFYGAGAKRVRVAGNVAVESQVENLVRFSPDGQSVCEGVYVFDNDFANDANGPPEKAVIDVRHCRRARVVANVLHSIANHACVAVGSHDGTGPGADDVLVYDNDCHGGTITLNGGSRNVTVELNRAHWGDKPDNQFIGTNWLPTMDNVRIANNSGVSPVAQKPMVGVMGTPGARRFVNENNVWTVTPA